MITTMNSELEKLIDILHHFAIRLAIWLPIVLTLLVITY